VAVADRVSKAYAFDTLQELPVRRSRFLYPSHTAFFHQLLKIPFCSPLIRPDGRGDTSRRSASCYPEKSQNTVLLVHLGNSRNFFLNLALDRLPKVSHHFCETTPEGNNEKRDCVQHHDDVGNPSVDVVLVAHDHAYHDHDRDNKCRCVSVS
jgi:hypothetical protein